MLRFVASIKKKYLDRLLVREKQWPPVRGDKLINLQLVQTNNVDGFSGSTDGTERTPIDYHELFSGKKRVKNVLVEGHAGIGKTTLSLMLSEEWAQGNILKQFDLVLLLPLREKKVACAESLPDLLKLLHSSEVIRMSVANELEEREGERVLIIADGWDELEEMKRSKDSFLYDLLFGDVVPFASVLVTSRPSASTSLRKLSSISHLVKVVGFDKENIKAFIESEFEDDPQKASGLLEQLRNNPILQSVCSVPLNCAITCYLWHTLKQELPSTMTGLYTQIILSVVYRDITKKFTEYADIMSLSSFDSIPMKLQPYWWRICEFAYETISNNQVVFSKEELEVFLPEALTSDQTIFCFGLLQCSPSLLLVGHGLSFSFLHLTFQEYLAALHILTLPVEKQLEICQNNALTNHFFIVWRFFFGLLSVQNDSNYLSLCRNLNTSMDIEGMLTTYPFKEDKLLLCHCALEYRCSHVSSVVSVLINEECQGNFPVAHNVLDCAAVCHILSHTKFCSSLLISMRSCGLGDKELEWLITPLSRAAGQLQVKRLDLSRNELTNTGISELFSVVPVAFSSLNILHLNDNQIGFVGLKTLFSSLRYDACCNLRHLSLSSNPLGVTGFEEIERAVLTGTLLNLYRLELANTLTPDADTNSVLLVALLEALATRCWGLTFLDISNNNLCMPGAQAVGRAICQLTQRVEEFDLLMNDTKLGDLGIIAFIESISVVCSLNSLNIQRNAITGVGLSSLVEVLCSGKVRVETIFLSYNPLGCSGALLIMKMLSSDMCAVRQLFLSSCQLTTTLTSTLDTASSNEVSLPYSDAFEHSQLSQKCYVTSLRLGGNSFTGKSIHCLAGLIYSCASSLRFLGTIDCQLTSKDLILLLKLLNQLHSSHHCSECLHTKLGQWYLNDNDLDDDGVATLIHHFPSYFPNLFFVCVDGNRVSKSMKRRLMEQCQIKPQVWVDEERALMQFNRDQVIAEWERTSSIPQSNELCLEYFVMWKQLLDLLCKYTSEMTAVAPLQYPLHVMVKSEPVVQLVTKATGEETTSERLSKHHSEQNEDLSWSTPRPLSCQITQSATEGSENLSELSAPITPVKPFLSSSLPNQPQRTGASRLNACEHLREIRTAVWDVRAKWRSLGLELGVDPYSLDAISVQHRDRPDDCLTHVLQQWLDRGDPEPTWDRLIEALEARPVGFLELARTLRDRHIG